MFRAITDTVSSLLANSRRQRVITPTTAIVKVNIGSGLAVADGWINLDGSLNALVASWPSFFHRTLYHLSDSRQWYSLQDYSRILRSHAFVHYIADQPLPFPDGTVDYVYTSHLLEHLYRQDAERLLGDVLRGLKPGGVIRVCVPDLERAFDLYKNGERLAALKLFFTELDKDPGRFNRHKFMYDFALLRACLEKQGYANITRCEYQRGKVPDLDKLDNRPAITLYVEAQKAPQTSPTIMSTGAERQIGR